MRAPPVAPALLLPAVVVDMTGTNKAVTALVHGAAVPLYQQLSDLLRERIRQGRYGPLDRLPSEHELVRDYAISRITARQALAELERAGVVFRVQGRGSFVAEPAVVQSLSRLSGLAEAMSGQGLSSRSRVLRATTTRASSAIGRRLGVGAGTQVFEIRRVRLVGGSPVSVDVSYFPLEVGRALGREDLEHRDVFWLLENVCHCRLGAADLEVGAVAADEDVAGHLGVAPGAPLVFIDRLTYDESGRPLDYEHLFVRADRFRYSLRLERGVKETDRR